MRIPRPLFFLRIAALGGLLASAMLVAERITPARRFCPLEEACEKARSSALGSIAGVPTSVIGLVGFAALLTASLLPSRRARTITRRVAVAGGVAGLVLLAYQAFALGSFCPLCLVADLSALAAGACAFAWSWRRVRRPERLAPRLMWIASGAVIVLIPLLWPTPKGGPSWVRIGGTGASPPFGVDGAFPRDPGSEPAPDEVRLVEYLNPFCEHCRATKERLDRAIASLTEPERARIRSQRVYVWTSRDVPFWAKGCACAKPQQKEPAFFFELMRAPRETNAEIQAAAMRAGLDMEMWTRCVFEPETLVPLEGMHRRVLEAKIPGLPVIDIGTRRLMGEQREPELWEALREALAR